MPDNFPVPPPPPRQNKPVPPPPPGKGPVPPSPVTTPAMAPAPARPASGPAPMPAGMPPARAGAAPGMPGMPAMGGNSALEGRMQEVERRFADQEATKKVLETQLADLQRQLKEEHEKVITQSVKAKEEEAVTVKIDSQLRDMQDKLRREKYEQELHDARSKAELQLKELERRMTEERETWMVALKNQLKEREQVEREVEDTLTRRLSDFERRYQNEKTEWMSTLRQKDEETNQVRRQLQEELDKVQEMVEEKERDIEALRDLSDQQRRATEQSAQNEVRALQNQMEAQLREGSTWKAQIALLQTQMHQLEIQHQEERSRWQGQLDRLQAEHMENRKRIESAAAVHEDDIKREFSRRDQERSQYWEGAIGQIRSEKESLRSALMRRDEDYSRLQMDMAEVKRSLEMERSRWATESEKMRRAGHEEAMRNLPEAVIQKIEAERKKIEEHFNGQANAMKQQMAKAVEAQKAIAAKLEIESKRAQQEYAALQNQYIDSEKARQTVESDFAVARSTFDAEKNTWSEESAAVEKQTREFLQRIAELQNREASVKEQLEARSKEWESRKAFFQAESEKTRAALAAAQSEIADREAVNKKFEAAVEAQKTEWMRQLEAGQEQDGQKAKELEALRNEVKTMAQAQVEFKGKEQEWESVHKNLREALNALRAEVVQVQGERTKQDAEWAEKEAIWNSTRAELEKKMAETAEAAKKAEEKALVAEKAASEKGIVKLSMAGGMEGAPISATLEGSPEAVKALAAIRTQMQEMQALLTWLRPVKRSMGKAA